jgi:parallel beta-helix repeat protein
MKQRRINATLTTAALALAILVLTALPRAGVFPLPASAEPLAQQGENMEPVGQIGGDTYVTTTVIYVPDDYPTIQAAVDGASPGDTIIVRDGTYTENVAVHKDRLTIESENGADSTIVQAANPDGHVFEVTADHVSIRGFAFMGGNGQSIAGIKLYYANYCTVSGNRISSNELGICLYHSSDNLIKGNNVSNNADGIFFQADSTNNIVTRNNIQDNTFRAIYLHSSSNNAIDSNICLNNESGIELYHSSDNTIRNNTFKNKIGAMLVYSQNNTIFLNDFINSVHNVPFPIPIDLTNIWNSLEELTYAYNGNIYTNHLGNYWSDYAGSDAERDGIGDTPYSIDGDKDNYPLMESFENYRVIGYAVIVAGQGGTGIRGYIDKRMIDHGANNAYKALRNLGFNDDHIVYLNSVPQQISGQDVVDDCANSSNFEDSLSEVKSEIGDSPTPLILYLIGHGDKEIFSFLPADEEGIGGDHLNSADLRSMLENFSSSRILAIIVSCYSGSFITLDFVTDSISIENRERIVITATHDDTERLWIGCVRFSDCFLGDLIRGFSVKDAFVRRTYSGDKQHLWLDDNGDAQGSPPHNLGDDGNLAAATNIGVPGTEDLELTPWIFVLKRSPGELRVYDSQNRVTGLVNGEVKEEIPDSIYDEENESVAILSPTDAYRYQVVAVNGGTYGLDIASIKDGDATAFTATDIPTSADATHQYTIDWDALSQGEEGIRVQVDSDGDGEFEHDFMADGELTRDEFLAGITTPFPVGGVIVPVDRFELLGPWIILVALAAMGAIGAVLLRRRDL